MSWLGAAIAIRRGAVGTLFVALVVAAAAVADTATSMGERSGEGSTAFTGLAQSPEANLFTGSLSTRIPIVVPPGRKHMTPDLALQYSSSAGPSPYGHGWNLTLGQVERTTRWGAPHCESEHFDEFVMMLPGGISAELVEDPPGSNQYRPRVEQAYLSATFHPAENRWTARDAAGMVYSFGDADAARLGTIYNPPLVASNPDGSCDFTTAWALTKIEDSNGNTMSITWTDMWNTGNQLLPELIEYGGNANGLGHFHSVRFIWLLHEGVGVPTFRRGVPQTSETYLYRIDVWTDLSPSGLIRSYVFIGSGQRDLYELRSVQVEDLPEQNFFYSDWEGAGHEEVAQPLAIPAGFSSTSIRRWSPTTDVQRSVLDMNGDGLLDLVRGRESSWDVFFGEMDLEPPPGQEPSFSFADTATPWAAPSHHIREVLESGCPHGHLCTVRDTFDITGDGVVDYVEAHDGFCNSSECKWRVYPGRYDGEAWGFETEPVLWPAPTSRIREDTSGKLDRDVIDMNGDGLPDYVRTDIVTGYWLVYVNTGSGFEAEPLHFSVPDEDITSLSVTETYGTTLMLADFNGDGLPDIIRSGSFDGEPTQAVQIPPGSGLYHYADSMSVYFNTGQGFSDPPLKILTPKNHNCIGRQEPVSGSVTRTYASLVDINGDGLPDCVYDNGSEWRVLLNTGGNLESIEYVDQSGTGNIFYAEATRVWEGPGGDIRRTFQNSGHGGQLVDMIDVNGDGFPDRVEAVSSTNWNVWLNRQATRPRLLDMMENGLGGTNTVRYEPSSHFEHVSAEKAPTLPFISWVVTATRLNDGQCVPPPGVNVFDPGQNPCVSSGNELLSFVEYADGYFAVENDTAGNLLREFRGFGTVAQRDVFGNLTRTHFHQEMHTKGLVESVWRYAGDEVTLIRYEANEWQEASFGAGGARTQVWLASNLRANLDGLSLEEMLFTVSHNDRPDAFGNVTHTWTGGSLVPAAVHSTNEFAAGGGGDAPRNKPMRTTTWEDTNGNGGFDPAVDRLLEEKRFHYEGASYGGAGNGNLTKIESRLIDDGGDRWLSTNMVYDAYGNITFVTDPKGRTTQSIYQFFGDGTHLYPVGVINPLGQTTITLYDFRHGKPVLVQGPNGAATRAQYGYDRLGRIVVEIQPGDTVEIPTAKYSYGFPSPPASGQDPWELPWMGVERKQDGHPTLPRWKRTYFDALGRQRFSLGMRMVHGGPNPTLVVSDRVQFDQGGLVVKRYVPYDLLGQPGAFTSYAYHFNGNNLIDPLGRVSWSLQPDGLTSVLTYYEGHSRRVIDAVGEQRVSLVDGLGRTVRTRTYHRPTYPHELYSSSESEYDGLGRLLAVYQNREQVDMPMKWMRYDTLGRKIEQFDRDSGLWRYGYDDVGNLLWQEDPKPDQHMQFCYDALDRPTKKCSFDLDLAAIGGQHYACHLQVSCAGGIDVVYEYDDPTVSNAVGRLTRVIDNAGETRVLGYDARGRQTAVVRRIEVDGQVGEAKFEYAYNTTNEVVEVVYPDGEVVQTTYDATGQPTALSNTAGYFYVESAHYDLFGRATSLVKGNGVEDKAHYDGAANNHRLLALHFDGGQSFSHAQSYHNYTKRGQVGTILDWSPQNHAANNGGSYTYDHLGRLVNYQSAVSGAAARAYQYNAWGNIIQRGEVELSYPDPALQQSAPHQVKTVLYGGWTTHPAHDANGNRMQIYEPPSAQYPSGANGGVVFNAEDRVATVNVGGGPDVHFLYDDGGQLKAKVVDEGIGGTSVTKYYAPQVEVRPDGDTIKSYFFGGQRVASVVAAGAAWQTDTLVAQASGWDSGVEVAAQWGPQRPVMHVTLEATGQTAAATALATALALLTVTLFLLPAGKRRRAVVSLRLDRAAATVLAIIVATGTMPWAVVIAPAQAQGPPPPPAAADISYFHYDHLGSPLVISDGSGNAVEHIRYHPYGAVRGRFDANKQPIAEPDADEVRYEFTGYEAERTTGLLYANARFYDPELGSFLSHDPAAEFWSPYTYVGWDPANGTDPTGACELVCLVLVGFAIGFAASAISSAINGASFGEAMKAGLIGGAIGAVTAPVGAYILKPALGSLIGGVTGVGAKTAGELASGILFVSGIGQSSYSASQGDFAGLIGLGLGLAAGAILAKGAQASDAGTIRDVVGRAKDHGYQEVSDSRAAGFRPSTNDFKIQHAATSWKGVTELATWVTGADRGPLHYIGRLIALPVVAAAGLGYEIQTAIGPLNPAGRYFDQQGPIDWLWDTPGDLLANALGLAVAAVPLPQDWATTTMRYAAQLIPGPNHISGHVCADYRCVSAPGGPNGLP